MATIYKNSQKQGTSSISTYDTLYNTSASTSAVISSILITNTSASSATYRIAITDSATTPTASQWLVYDGAVAGKDTIALTLGITLSNSQFIRFSSSANTVTFSAYISEIS
jgi:hypothetical protein